MAKAMIRAMRVLAFAICLVPSAAGASENARGESTQGPKPFAEAKLIIEHNATDEDTGFQAFVDGEPWNRLSVEGPDGRNLLDIRARDELKALGLTELFFETDEPPNKEVPIEELLARFPEGEYAFEGRSVEGATMTGTANLSHLIPAGPEILAPPEGAVVDPNNTVIEWKPVTESINGKPVEIAGYEVIVVKDVKAFPPGFSNIELSVHVTPSTTSLTVPPEFFEPATPYTFEVLALEAGGNQTISSSSFSTP
jgi:hypothetical protein